MATLYLYWTTNLNGNVIKQRVSKRIKSVGGVFDTTGFTPANDMPPDTNTATVFVTPNKVYEFHQYQICTENGPTENSEGIQEQIVFACIVPSLVGHEDSVDVDINLAGTDIESVDYAIRKQSDDSLISSVLGVVRVSNGVPYTFSGLAATTGYYIQMTLHATIDGSSVGSDDSDYLNTACGGNVTGYQVSTAAAPPDPTVIIQNGLGGMIITSITGIDGFAVSGNILTGQEQTGTHTLNGPAGICVNLGGSPALTGHMIIKINEVVQQCIASIDFFSSNCFYSVTILTGDIVKISLEIGACP